MIYQLGVRPCGKKRRNVRRKKGQMEITSISCGNRTWFLSGRWNTIFDKSEVHRAVHRNIISIVKPTRCTNVSNLFHFWNDTSHVSDGVSVHHQEFKTVHTTTGICQTDTAV